MLQIPSAKPAAELRVDRSIATSPAEPFAATVHLVRRRRVILVAIFGLSLLCGAVYLSVAPPKFMAEAQLLIDTKRSEPFPQQSSQAAEPTRDSAAVDSQIQVLKSEGVENAIVKDLHLTD